MTVLKTKSLIKANYKTNNIFPFIEANYKTRQKIDPHERKSKNEKVVCPSILRQL